MRSQGTHHSVRWKQGRIGDSPMTREDIWQLKIGCLRFISRQENKK